MATRTNSSSGISHSKPLTLPPPTSPLIQPDFCDQFFMATCRCHSNYIGPCLYTPTYLLFLPSSVVTLFCCFSMSFKGLLPPVPSSRYFTRSFRQDTSSSSWLLWDLNSFSRRLISVHNEMLCNGVNIVKCCYDLFLLANV